MACWSWHWSLPSSTKLTWLKFHWAIVAWPEDYYVFFSTPSNYCSKAHQGHSNAWEQLPISDLDKHIDIMLDCVQAILAVKGRHTHSFKCRIYISLYIPSSNPSLASYGYLGVEICMILFHPHRLWCMIIMWCLVTFVHHEYLKRVELEMIMWMMLKTLTIILKEVAHMFQAQKGASLPTYQESPSTFKLRSIPAFH